MANKTKLGGEEIPTKEKKNLESPNIVPKKNFHSENYLQTSKSPFGVEAKVEIKLYDDQMDLDQLSNWLKLEIMGSPIFQWVWVYQHRKDLILLTKEGYALLWWESVCHERFLTKKKQVANWEELEALVKSQFYPMG